MATSGYGATAPGALDPFSIESTLANIVGTNNPAAAGGALDLYQLKNQVSQSNYGFDQAQQHAYAKEALKQQLLETQMKEFHNIAKLPGGARFLAAGGVPGMDFGGAPGALTGLAEAGDVAQGAENFQKGMAGFASGSEGGLLTDPSMIPGLPPNFRGVLTDNAKVRAANIAANAHLQAAAMKGTQEGKVTVTTPLPGNTEATPHNISQRVPASQVDQTVAAHDRLASGILERRGSGDTTTTTPVSGSLPPAPGTAAQPPASPVKVPPAPTRPAATPAANPVVGSLDTSSPKGREAQNKAMMTAHAWSGGDLASQQAAKDIQDGMRAPGVFDMHITKNGTYRVKGKTGHFYDVQ